jgi:hypothetical protein
METKASPLVLEDFIITFSNCDIIGLQTANKNINKIRDKQANYPVLIDYDIKKMKDKSDFIIGMRVIINPNKLEGYNITVSGVGYFTISEITNQKEIANLIHFSALNICIANLRSYIANMTSYFPMGRYNFKAIDMLNLIKSKQSEGTPVKK